MQRTSLIVLFCVVSLSHFHIAQGQLTPCSPVQQAQCGNPQVPSGELPCFINGAGPDDFICNCNGHPFFNMGRLCTTPVPVDRYYRSSGTSLQTCYGCSKKYFTSINYPNKYEDDRGDVYLLYLPGAREINFRFSVPFAVEANSDYDDAVFVGAGLGFTHADVSTVGLQPGLTGDNLYFFDNRIITQPGQFNPTPGATPPPFTIMGDSAWIYFRTDGSSEGGGFNLTWYVTGQPCDSNPCLNGGQCFDVPLGFFCSCSAGFSGDKCEIPPISGQPCDSSPCLNGGQCFNLQSGIFCRCSDSFSGNRCEIASGPFDASPEIICPSMISDNAITGQGGTFLTYSDQVTCTDDVGVASIICSPSSASFFSIGTTTVSCVCTNAGGNIDPCIFSVVIAADAVSPMVTMCPTSMNFTICDSEFEVSWTPPRAVSSEDCLQALCPEVVTRSSHSPGDSFKVGKTDVIYTFEDQSGNIAQCIFQINVHQQTENCGTGSYVLYVVAAVGVLCGAVLVAISLILCIKRCKTIKHNDTRETHESQNRDDTLDNQVSVGLQSLATENSYMNMYEREIFSSETRNINVHVRHVEVQ